MTRTVCFIPLFLFICLQGICFPSPDRQEVDQYLSLAFYDQNLQLRYEEGIKYPYAIRIDELALRRLYSELERRPYQSFLNSLQEYARSLQLNDWLYAQLVNQSLQKLYESNKSEPIVLYTTYFLLAKSGYDVRLTYRDRLLQVNVFTEEVLYEIPLIQDGRRQYANISTDGQVPDFGRSMYLLNHQPNPNGNAFSFTMSYWPKILSQQEERVVSFSYKGFRQELKLSFNPGLAQLLQDYPLVNEHWYLDAPLSEPLRNTLVPQLGRLIQGRSQRESLELLVAFTRSAFDYKDDKEAFGTNKPMVADELFFYPFSDCEDRSALFYALVKALLDLPMIVIAYDDHLSVAVAAPGLEGDAVNFDGRKYIFCDPTGPRNSSEIGNVPQGYENKSFEIIGTYPGE